MARTSLKTIVTPPKPRAVSEDTAAIARKLVGKPQPKATGGKSDTAAISISAPAPLLDLVADLATARKKAKRAGGDYSGRATVSAIITEALEAHADELRRELSKLGG